MPTFTRRPAAARSLIASIVIAAGGLGLSGAPALAASSGPSAREVHRPDLERAFTDRSTVGTMVVRQRGAVNRTVIVGARRSRLRILPSSTFKVPNALIAIDQGIASGPDQAYPGPNPNYLLDGKPLLPPVCEGDLTLTIAFQNSCIPIFQSIARQVGTGRYNGYVHAFHYGNEQVRGAAVDDFWLHGPFAISAREQVDFLERFAAGRLPVSRRAVADVREMMVVERKDGYVLRGKTGFVFAQDGQPQRGWWVGSVERAGEVSTFALNLDMQRADLIPARVEIGRALLTELDAFAPR